MWKTCRNIEKYEEICGKYEGICEKHEKICEKYEGVSPFTYGLRDLEKFPISSPLYRLWDLEKFLAYP